MKIAVFALLAFALTASAALSQQQPQSSVVSSPSSKVKTFPAAEDSPPRVYLIAELRILKPELYRRYMERVPEVIRKYGGKYLVRGGEITPFSGGWKPDRIIIIEFESREQLQRCFSSPEYLKVAPFREESTTGRAIIVEAPVETD